jgi:hypothetical protein
MMRFLPALLDPFGLSYITDNFLSKRALSMLNGKKVHSIL